MRFFTSVRFFCVFIFLFTFSFSANASFQKHLWPKWEVHNPLSKESISHQEWQAFLDCCVVTNHEGISLVDYANLNDSDLELLNRYVDRMSQIEIGNYSRDEQLAFWINLYNALIVQNVANYYPIQDIKEINISPGLFSQGPWGAHLITIQDTRLTLDEIHDRIIRAVWNDPRTHYALNDATIGCANLSKQVYKGATIDVQLNKAATDYINSLRGTQIIDGKLIVSKMYEWYAEDFGEQRDVITHIQHYTQNLNTQKQLKDIQEIHSYVYNWHLNSTAKG